MHIIEQYQHKSCGKYRVEIPLDHFDQVIHTIVIKGKDDGPWVLVDSGIHSAEFNGIKAVMELSNTIDPTIVHGGIIMIPCVNEDGFNHRSPNSVAMDGKNLNRVFPGNIHGTLADVLAYTLMSEVVPFIDYVIDIHSGDAYEQLHPFVFALGACSDHVNQISLQMAKQCNVDYIAISMTTTGGFYNVCGSIGIPSILIERGGMNDWNDAWVNQDKDDVINLLKGLQVLDGDATIYDPYIFDHVEYIRSPQTGLWLSQVYAGQTIAKDQCLGTITNVYGDPLASIEAKGSGVVLYQTHSLNAIKEGALIAYGVYHDKKKY